MVVVVVVVVLGVGVVVVVVAEVVDDFLDLACGFWRCSDKPPIAEVGSHNVRSAKAISFCHHDRAGASPSSSPSSPSSPPASSFGVEEEEGPAAAGDSGAALTVGWLISNHLQKLGTGCPKTGGSRSLGTPSLPPVPASLGEAGGGGGGVRFLLLVVVVVVVVAVVVVVGGVAVFG